MVAPPRDPIAAVTHPDPYPYYAELVTHEPCYRDEHLGLWVAAGAAATTAILTSDTCLVRPPAERVPAALVGSRAGAIFGQLVRMNDGREHQRAKRAVSSTLTAVSSDDLIAHSTSWAQWLINEREPQHAPRQITGIAFDISVYVLATLLGVPQSHLARVAAWIADFVGCLAPGSDNDRIARGIGAADSLFDVFHATLVARSAGGLLARLARDAEQSGIEDETAAIANGIGFLSQAYEATAGLIGNTVLTLATHPDLREQVMAEPKLLRSVIQETVRFDPPVQNTRRFLAHDATLAGHQMREGDTILVVLAAANRDPAANVEPARFDPHRAERQSFTFGLGRHACPGEMIATTIAEATVRELLSAGCVHEALAANVTYRASANLRIPLWSVEDAATDDEEGSDTQDDRGHFRGLAQ